MPQTFPHEPPFVVTLDVGSSSVRAMCFDARGRALDAERQCGYAMDTTADGGVQIDPDRLLALTADTLDGLLGDLGGRSSLVAAVSISTFWHTLLGVGADDRARTPLFSWADTRSAAEVEALRTQLDEKAYHARTGCVFHTSYLPARLRWLAERDPVGFRAVRRWMSFGEYLQFRFNGEPRASISMASATGLFDQTRQVWDAPTLAALELGPEHLAPLADLDEPLPGLRSDVARRWPALRSVAWFPAVGDGACSNVGAGCTGPDRVALMVGTSGAMRVCWATDAVTVPPGLWRYRVDRRRILLGGSLANGGSVYAWLGDTLRLGPREEVECAIAAMPADAHGLTLLPFLAGERAPGWVANARAAIVGLSLATRPLDILRAGLETVAYRFAMIYELLREACPQADQIVATGGALLGSPAWVRIMADVLGRPVTPSAETEASSRGAALLALEALGVLPSLAAAPAGLGRTLAPDPERHARYRDALARHRELYEALIPLYTPGGGSRPPSTPGRPA